MPLPSPATTGQSAHSEDLSQRRAFLGARVAVRLSLFLAVAIGMLFLSAGTWRFWQAWIYLVLVFAPVTWIFVYFLTTNPTVIERRLESDEPIATQKALIRWLRPLFFAAFLVPGLDHRFGWSRVVPEPVPLWVTILCDALVLVSLLFVGWVLDINNFASRTIHVEQSQPLISTGPYCLIRHPLYSGSLLLMLATPLALGSWVALPVFALLVPFYVLRLLDEEKMLRRELAGYSAYCHRTPFRLIPFVW